MLGEENSYPRLCHVYLFLYQVRCELAGTPRYFPSPVPFYVSVVLYLRCSSALSEPILGAGQLRKVRNLAISCVVSYKSYFT